MAVATSRPLEAIAAREGELTRWLHAQFRRRLTAEDTRDAIADAITTAHMSRDELDGLDPAQLEAWVRTRAYRNAIDQIRAIDGYGAEKRKASVSVDDYAERLATDDDPWQGLDDELADAHLRQHRRAQPRARDRAPDARRAAAAAPAPLRRPRRQDDRDAARHPPEEVRAPAHPRDRQAADDLHRDDGERALRARPRPHRPLAPRGARAGAVGRGRGARRGLRAVPGLREAQPEAHRGAAAAGARAAGPLLVADAGPRARRRRPRRRRRGRRRGRGLDAASSPGSARRPRSSAAARP